MSRFHGLSGGNTERDGRPLPDPELVAVPAQPWLNARARVNEDRKAMRNRGVAIVSRERAYSTAHDTLCGLSPRRKPDEREDAGFEARVRKSRLHRGAHFPFERKRHVHRAGGVLCLAAAPGGSRDG